MTIRNGKSCDRDRISALIGLIAGLTLLWGGAAQAMAKDRPLRVAVLNFANQEQGPEGKSWDWLEKGLADLVINELATADGLQLVDRQRMQQTLRAQGLAGIHRLNRKRFSKPFVERFKVQRLVFGSFRVKNEQLSITVSIIHAKRNALLDRMRVQGKAQNALKLQRKLAGRLTASLLGTDDAKQRIASIPVWTDSLGATKLLYRGIDHFDQGRFEKAWLFARRAHRTDSDYPDPLYWIGRLHYYMLQYDHARPYLADFVTEHPDHPRVGDAAIEYLDSFERGEDDPKKLAREVARVAKRVPDEAPVQTYKFPSNTQLLYQWDLGHYLAMRRARYLMACSEYAKALRVLAPHYRGDPDGVPKDKLAINLFFHARTKTGKILGQPTTLGRLTKPRQWLEPFAWPGYRGGWMPGLRPILLRPGAPAISLMPDPKRRRLISRSLAVVPPNHQLEKLAFNSRARGPLPTSSLKDNRRFGEEFIIARLDAIALLSRAGPPEQTHQYSKLESEFDNHHFELRPFPEGKFGVLSVWFDGSIAADWDPPQNCDIKNLTLRATLEPQNHIAHVLAEPGVKGVKLQSAERDDDFISSNEKSCFLSLDTVRQTDLKPDDAERSEPLIRALHHVNSNETQVARRPTEQAKQFRERSPGFRLKTVARNYGSVFTSPYRDDPTIAIGHEGQWVMLWTFDDDLWMTRSYDQGETWSPPQELPVPVNSAHQDGTPHLVRLSSQRYALIFSSDRGVPRRVRWYVTISTDLHHWTDPRALDVDTVRGAQRGLTGELIFWGHEGVERAPDSAWAKGKPGLHRATGVPVVGRLGDDNELEILRKPRTHAERHERTLLIPLIGWRDEAGLYHMVAYRRLRQPWLDEADKSWRQRNVLIEYTAKPGHELKPQRYFRHAPIMGEQDFMDGLNLQAIISNGQLFISGFWMNKVRSETLLQFRGRSLSSDYTVARFKDYGFSDDAVVDAVTRDGRILLAEPARGETGRVGIGVLDFNQASDPKLMGEHRIEIAGDAKKR